MQELENILEEIDDCICEWLSTPTDKFDQGYIKGLRRAKKIIYKNMNEKDINTAGELISRQALLDDFRNTITENSDTFDWLNMIARQPTVNKGDGWIAVEERLPEESLNSVIGWDEYRERCCFVQYYSGRWILGNDIEPVKITAWRPLPEPYKPKPQNEPEEHYPEWRTKFLGKFDKRV